MIGYRNSLVSHIIIRYEYIAGITYTGGEARQRASSRPGPVEGMATPCRVGQGREENLMVVQNDNDVHGGSDDYSIEYRGIRGLMRSTIEIKKIAAAMMPRPWKPVT